MEAAHEKYGPAAVSGSLNALVHEVRDRHTNSAASARIPLTGTRPAATASHE
jgi:hypothetical protein